MLFLNKFFKRIWVWLYVLVAANLFAGNIENIKCVYTILAPEHRELSVIHGAVLWERGVIRRLYDFGDFGEKERASKKNPLIKMMETFFYRVSDSTSIQD